MTAHRAGRVLRGGAVALAVVAVLAGGWWSFVRQPPRHQVGALSCTSTSFRRTAVDFSGVPSWASAQEALDYAFQLDPSLPTDGWELHFEPDVARWERHDGSHLVGLSVHHRGGHGWLFAMPDACEETRS